MLDGSAEGTDGRADWFNLLGAERAQVMARLLTTYANWRKEQIQSLFADLPEPT